MKKDNWRVLYIISLLFISVAFYLIHYAIFRDSYHIFIYLIGDIAFLFVQLLLVTLILQKLLENREKEAMLKKLNMVIGAFFSEIGISLLKLLAGKDPQAIKIKENLSVDSSWRKKDYQKARQIIRGYTYSADWSIEELNNLRMLLIGKRNFLLRLLENPNLLEHETFTELLWAVFHLTEELAARDNLSLLPESDLEHLKNDIKRVYASLILQWLSYMEHLCTDYPFLFSFAMRTNPFKPDSKPEITG